MTSAMTSEVMKNRRPHHLHPQLADLVRHHLHRRQERATAIGIQDPEAEIERNQQQHRHHRLHLLVIANITNKI
jgi:hypothetical protein